MSHPRQPDGLVAWAVVLPNIVPLPDFLHRRPHSTVTLPGRYRVTSYAAAVNPARELLCALRCVLTLSHHHAEIIGIAINTSTIPTA